MGGFVDRDSPWGLGSALDLVCIEIDLRLFQNRVLIAFGNWRPF